MSKSLDEKLATLSAEDQREILKSVPSALRNVMRLYGSTPQPVLPWLNERVEEFLRTITSKMVLLTNYGPFAEYDEIGSVLEDYDSTVKEIPEHDRPQGSVDAGTRELAEIIDKTVRRVLITATNPKYVNREAIMDLQVGLGYVARAMQAINDVPTDYGTTERKATQH